MLSDAQLADIVKDFYETVISEENKARLKNPPITEYLRLSRIEYHDKVIRDYRGALARNELDKIKFTADMLLSKRNLFGKLNGVEVAGFSNQVQHLRFSRKASAGVL
jgi:hypothetical protein